MRATGIIRRIDDLGRVVIPREIRRSLGIKDGDPLEIYTTDEGVFFKKYNGREEAMCHAFEPMRLALYKTGYSVSLYANDCYMHGRHLGEEDFTKLTHIHIGVWGGMDWTISYVSDEIAIGGEQVAFMLHMMAESMKEVARELYGDE